MEKSGQVGSLLKEWTSYSLSRGFVTKLSQLTPVFDFGLLHKHLSQAFLFMVSVDSKWSLGEMGVAWYNKICHLV